jgi:hypothetical protein
LEMTHSDKCSSLLHYKIWRHDTQHNDIKHNDIKYNDTQHNGVSYDTQHK